MMNYKFTIGQNVKVKSYNPWMGDYEVPATVIGFGNLILNGIPTYNVKTIHEEILNQISEKDLLPLN